MNSDLSTLDVVLRILAATLAGALVGWERESHGRAAGLRTTMLACVAAAIAMIISELLFSESVKAAPSANWRPDPARLGAGILTGIGFLGAGTILRHSNVIRGVTTAASLWFVTVLGLAFGNGLFRLGAIGTTVALVILVILPSLEKHIRTDWYSTLTVTMELDRLTEQQLRERLRAFGLKIIRMELNYDLAAKQKIVSCEMKIDRSRMAELSEKVVAELRQTPGVLQIKWV